MTCCGGYAMTPTLATLPPTLRCPRCLRTIPADQAALADIIRESLR